MFKHLWGITAFILCAVFSSCSNDNSPTLTKDSIVGVWLSRDMEIDPISGPVKITFRPDDTFCLDYTIFFMGEHELEHEEGRYTLYDNIITMFSTTYDYSFTVEVLEFDGNNAKFKTSGGNESYVFTAERSN